MDIQVSGKQLKIGKSLTDYAKEHLYIINNKYLLRPTFAYITFTKENKEFKCFLTYAKFQSSDFISANGLD